MPNLVRKIICAKKMEMSLKKFRQMVINVENSAWFQRAVSDGIIIKQYLPYAQMDSNCLGQFTKGGFQFSCKELSVYFTANRICKSASYFLLNHITDRNRITWRIMNIIADKQYEFIQTGDPLTLRYIPYQTIVEEYKKTYPNYYMDESIISRVVKNRSVLLLTSKAISLHHLLPRKSYLVGVRIKDIITNKKKILSDKQVCDELYAQFNMDYTTRYITYCRDWMGIPPARARGKYGRKSLSAWDGLFLWVRQNLTQFRRVQVCMN